MCRSIRRTEASVAIVVALVCHAYAGPLYTPVSQARLTEVSAQVSSGETPVIDSDFESATDFGPFNSTLAASATLGVPIPSTADGAATQNSDILPSSITGTGSSSAVAEANDPSFTTSSFGASSFTLEFDVTTAVDYVLTGELSTAIPLSGDGAAASTLSGPGGIVFDFFTADGTVLLADSGTLSPGTYLLSVFTESFANESGDSASGSFDFDLSFVPEPASLALLGAGCLLLGRRR